MALRFPRSLVFFLAIPLIPAVPARAEDPRPATPSRQALRVTFMLGQLADQARMSDDIVFSVRAQAEAATLMWAYDRDGARAIFRRTYDAISRADASSDRLAPSTIDREAKGISRSNLEQLRSELMNKVAARDPELAEEFARKLAFAKPCPAAGARDPEARNPYDASSLPYAVRREAEGRELLIDIALQIVERDPQRAMTLAQLSLADGISPNLARLLVLMRAVDAGLADLLFSNAVTLLEGSDAPSLADIHTLGSYLVSSANPAGDSISRPVIIRFLTLALDQIMEAGSDAPYWDGRPAFRRVSLDDTSAAYFIARQLVILFSRYLPGRLPQLQQRIAALSQSSVFDRPIEPDMWQAREGPADIERGAGNRQDPGERNSLYARAALGWLAGGDVGQAQEAALRVSDAGMRDRVLGQIVRRQAARGLLEDAVATSQLIEGEAARVPLLVNVASIALRAGDRVRAAELLDQAELAAVKEPASLARAQGLLTIVGNFSAFDALRAFEVMQTAVRAINELSPGKKEAARPLLSANRGYSPQYSYEDGSKQSAGPAADLLYHLNFEGTLAVLARSDYDRAMLLARQLTGKEVSVIAQLAVCRGGLAGPPDDRETSEADQAETGQER